MTLKKLKEKYEEAFEVGAVFIRGGVIVARRWDRVEGNLISPSLLNSIQADIRSMKFKNNRNLINYGEYRKN